MRIIDIEQLGGTSRLADECVLMPFERHPLRLRRQIDTLSTQAPNLYPVVVIHRRFRILARILLRGASARACVVTSPEPDRLGLTIGRVLNSVGILIHGTEITSASSGSLDSLLGLLRNQEDLGLVGIQSLSISFGVHIRLAQDLVAIRSSTANLIGNIDESYRDFQDIVDDLAGRLVEHNIPVAGLQHDGLPARETHPRIAQRFPWITGISSPGTSLERQHPRMSSSNVGVPTRVLVDLRSVSSDTNGTGQHALRALTALAEQNKLRLVALLSERSSQAVSKTCHKLGIRTLDEITKSTDTFDLAFRPHQFDDRVEIAQLRNIARSVVTSQLDFIAADNPSYHPSVDAWQKYQQETILALMSSDGVSWLTGHSRNQAESRGLDLKNIPNRICGTVAVSSAEDRTIGCSPISEPYLAIVGASYHHKGRQYALEVIAHALRLGWSGKVVISGWDPPHGSSRSCEEETIRQFPHLQDSLVRLGELSSADHLALVHHATALVQPSFDEGFGLTAAEAAALGTPTFMLRRAGLKYIYPTDYPGWLEGNSAIEDARYIVANTSSPDLMSIAGIQRLQKSFSSENFAQQTIELFEAVIGS